MPSQPLWPCHGSTASVPPFWREWLGTRTMSCFESLLCSFFLCCSNPSRGYKMQIMSGTEAQCPKWPARSCGCSRPLSPVTASAPCCPASIQPFHLLLRNVPECFILGLMNECFILNKNSYWFLLVLEKTAQMAHKFHASRKVKIGEEITSHLKWRMDSGGIAVEKQAYF